MIGYGDAHDVDDALVASRAALLIELQLRLNVFGGKRNADLQSASNAA